MEVIIVSIDFPWSKILLLSCIKLFVFDVQEKYVSQLQNLVWYQGKYFHLFLTIPKYLRRKFRFLALRF